MTDPIKSRMASPPLVRKISTKCLKQIKSLQESIDDMSDEAASGEKQ